MNVKTLDFFVNEKRQESLDQRQTDKPTELPRSSSADGVRTERTIHERVSSANLSDALEPVTTS